MAENMREKFLTRYNGLDLLKKHSLNEEGTWAIFGEDPNCDFGGHHHQPELGIYQGKLTDVIDIAVNLPSFWQWGPGGDIRKIKIKKADSSKRRIELQKRREKLMCEIEDIENELGKI
jgi:hypothetical protein